MATGGSSAADDWLFLSAESAAPRHLHASSDEPQVEEDKGKFKSKLVSAWNSVKYGLLSDFSSAATSWINIYDF